MFPRMNVGDVNDLNKIQQKLGATKYDGYDLVKAGAAGYVVGRVSFFERFLQVKKIWKFRAAPIIVGIGAGILLDTYVKLPRAEPYVNQMYEKVTDLFQQKWGLLYMWCFYNACSSTALIIFNFSAPFI